MPYTIGVRTIAVASKERTAVVRQPTPNTRTNKRPVRPPPTRTATEAARSKTPAFSATADSDIIPTSKTKGSAVSDSTPKACLGETRPETTATPPPRAAHHARLTPHGRASTRTRVATSITPANSVTAIRPPAYPGRRAEVTSTNPREDSGAPRPA